MLRLILLLNRRRMPPGQRLLGRRDARSDREPSIRHGGHDRQTCSRAHNDFEPTMDDRGGLILLFIPILIVVAGYLMAWRGKSAELRKAGNLMVAAIVGPVALFGPWWRWA